MFAIECGEIYGGRQPFILEGVGGAGVKVGRLLPHVMPKLVTRHKSAFVFSFRPAGKLSTTPRLRAVPRQSWRAVAQRNKGGVKWFRSLTFIT